MNFFIPEFPFGRPGTRISLLRSAMGPINWRSCRLPLQRDASVAQLDRALASEAKGCGFDPRRMHSGIATRWKFGRLPLRENHP